MAVLEDSEAVPDGLEACLWLLRGKLKHVLGLLRRDLLAHDLAGHDSAKLHGDVRAVANFDAEDIWVSKVKVVRLAEVLGDGLGATLTKREAEVLRTLSEESLNNAGGSGLSCGCLAGIGEDADASDEPVEAVVFALGEVTSGRKIVRLIRPRVPANELQAEANEGTVFVHDSGGDIDVDQHSPDGRTNRPAMNLSSGLQERRQKRLTGNNPSKGSYRCLYLWPRDL